MSLMSWHHLALEKELDWLIGHARADAIVATGGEGRTISDPAAQELWSIGFAAGRLKALEDIRALLHSERPDA